MSKDKDQKQEILPPAKQLRGAVSPFAGEKPPAMPSGVISSLKKCFVADLEAEAYRRLAKRLDAQDELVKAQTVLYRSGGTLMRETEALRDIGATLDNDQAERDAARKEAAHQREDAAYRREDTREEREHQRTLARTRRLREQREADRSLFNAEQGLKKQEDIAPYMFGTWTAKAEGLHINERRVEELRREARERDARQETARQQNLDDLIRAQQQALAKGDETEADRLQGEIDRINGVNEETIYSNGIFHIKKDIHECLERGGDATQLSTICKQLEAAHESELRARRRARENPDP